VQFTIVVKEQGVDTVKRIAKAVSDPDSAEYGNYTTQEELNGITVPRASRIGHGGRHRLAQGGRSPVPEGSGVSNLPA